MWTYKDKIIRIVKLQEGLSFCDKNLKHNNKINAQEKKSRFTNKFSGIKNEFVSKFIGLQLKFAIYADVVHTNKPKFLTNNNTKLNVVDEKTRSWE